MLWCRHRQVPGRQDTVLVADSWGAHVSKEPRMAKMDVSAAKMALAVWNGYVWDARHVHSQWRPVEQALHDAMVWVS